MMIPFRPATPRVPALLAMLLALGLSGCGDGEPEGADVQVEDAAAPAVERVDPTAIDYADELEIDFDDFERTESGLYYRVDAEGEGDEAVPGREVEAHYTGYLPNGQVFDTSRDGESGISFPLGRGAVIAGWDEGLEGMRVGEQRTLVIPPELAYGTQGAGGGVIPPNAVLVFEVELVAVR